MGEIQVTGQLVGETVTVNKRPSYFVKNHPFYLMLAPAVLYFLIFRYIPLAGSVIAFKDYNIFKGIIASDWVGLQWFHQLFTFPKFVKLLQNTLLIGFYQIIFAFPAPIILAILMNELRMMKLKRVIQTIVYLPHFLSWTIVAGLVYMLLSVQTGLVNTVYVNLTGNEPINFLQNVHYVRTIIVSSGMWKEVGWGTIIFLAALTGISPSLYEASTIDGAGRWKQFVHITLPGLLPAITVMLLLKLGHVMDLGFEQIYPFLNPLTSEKADVFDTYTYRAGVVGGQYSFTTAVGLFKSVVGFTLLLVFNKASKVTTGEGLF
ncbi:sugar ABC transporter permease [Paenibacillus sp. YN15]|uniref:ABC transporter permease n=1 Tax=Paenibacillus sp. YN15 TaxID=1742774 RepID=UPI00215D36D3|nr:ABC transporter permease subunit [Paenibacillus sp. YN15]